jgi:hypothetical protein
MRVIVARLRGFRAGSALGALGQATAGPLAGDRLDDPDAGRADVTGQPGAVAAGALDPGQAHRPEPAQPAQQAGVAGCGGGELPGAEQPAGGIERGGDMRICAGDPRRR